MGDAELAPHLAVDLQDQLHGFGPQGRCVDLRPRSIQQIAQGLRESEFAPELPGDVRDHGVQHAQQDGGRFRQRGRLGTRLGGGLQRVEHLHGGRDYRVVLDALVVVIGLLEQRVDLAAQRGAGLVESGPVGGRRGLGAEGLALRLAERPQPAQESMRALYARIRPLQRLFRRACEHDEQARGIRPHGFDERLGVDAVVLGLGHGADAAVVHGRAVCLQARPHDGALVVGDVFDLIGPEVLDAPAFVVPRIDVVEHHALAQQSREGLGELHHAQVAHDARPEARIQQVQHGVLDAADVLVHRHPVVVARIHHGPVVAGRRIAHEVPGRVDEGVHGVGFAPRGLAAARAVARQERLALGERVARAVRHQVVRQDDRQIFLGDGHRPAIRAVDDGNGGAPVALAGNAPVAQAPGGAQLAQAHGLEIARNGLDGLRRGQAVILARIHRMADLLVAVPFLPGVGGIGVPFGGDHLADGQFVFAGEGKVAFVVRRHAHDGAVAIAHEHVVADPHGHGFAGERVGDGQPCGQAFFFARREFGFGRAALAARFDEGRQCRVVPGGVRRQRVFGSHGAEGDPHDGVGARREDVHQTALDELARVVADVVSEGKAHPFAAPQPVFLHQPHPLRPAGQAAVFQGRQQFVGVVGDAQVVARDLALFDQGA
ncbi:hypothetical protein CDEF62S_03111 [Castellaniella defragrans]